jgi:hypothetical protein
MYVLITLPRRISNDTSAVLVLNTVLSSSLDDGLNFHMKSESIRTDNKFKKKTII